MRAKSFQATSHEYLIWLPTRPWITSTNIQHVTFLFPKGQRYFTIGQSIVSEVSNYLYCSENPYILNPQAIEILFSVFSGFKFVWKYLNDESIIPKWSNIKMSKLIMSWKKKV